MTNRTLCDILNAIAYYRFDERESKMEKENSFVEYDQNMIVQASIRDIDVEMYDIRQNPFEVYGFYNYREEPWFIRMPDAVAAEVSEGVQRASKESAGGRVRFSTDSDCIAIRTEMCAVAYSPHLTLLETGGFDLYVDGERVSRLAAPFVPPYGMKEGYEQIVKFRSAEMRNITVNFPIHARVKQVWIGLSPGAKLGKGKPYCNTKPVIFYGSSITHGSAASRPGLTYPHMLSRRLNLNIYNLGFSGQCKGESRMAQYIADLDMSAFIMDYDHNAPTSEYLEETHRPFFEAVRGRQPDLPIVMLSRPNIYPESKTNKRNRDIIWDTYHRAVAAGDRNVYFVDGSEYLKGHGYDDCILDGIHPNDMGFAAMADAIQAILEKIMAKSRDFTV